MRCLRSTTSLPSTESTYERRTPSKAPSRPFGTAPSGQKAACRTRRRLPWSSSLSTARRKIGAASRHGARRASSCRTSALGDPRGRCGGVFAPDRSRRGRNAQRHSHRQRKEPATLYYFRDPRAARRAGKRLDPHQARRFSASRGAGRNERRVVLERVRRHHRHDRGLSRPGPSAARSSS